MPSGAARLLMGKQAGGGSTLWAQDFTAVSDGANIDGTAPDTGPGNWTEKATEIEGEGGNGISVSNNVYYHWIVLDQGEKLYGKTITGTLHWSYGTTNTDRSRHMLVMSDSATAPTTSAGNWIGCGVNPYTGKLRIKMYTATDGAVTVNGTVDSADVTVSNELTFSVDADTVAVDSSYDSISHTLTANEKSDLDSATVTEMGLFWERTRWHASDILIDAEMLEA